MGISVRELLLNDEFKDFKLIAGKAGLEREVQGLTFLEAPDAFKWSKGGELVVSSGYIISRCKNVIDEAFKDGSLLNTSGLIIKRGRFLDDIPEGMIEKFEEFNVPLIIMPFNIAWMELISRTNSVVINRCLTKFQVQLNRSLGKDYKDYKSRKINKVLSEIEKSMDFPCALFDVESDEVFYSSSKFRSLTSYYELKNEQFINTTLNHTRHTLCDYSQMTRFRVLKDNDGSKPPVSWLRVAIYNHESIVAYLVVLEARRLIDHLDEVMIRLAYMNLTNLYESENERERESALSFDSIVGYALVCDDSDKKKLDEMLLSHGISNTRAYRLALLDFTSQNSSSNHDSIQQCINNSSLKHYVDLIEVESNEIALVAEANRLESLGEPFEDCLTQLANALAVDTLNSNITIATDKLSAPLPQLRNLLERVRRVMRLGKVFSRKSVVSYDDLGPLAWIDIPPNELDGMLKIFRDALEGDRNAETLNTLKVYLANNMNYSITSEITSAHINTVRRRVDVAKDLLRIDLEDSLERMKLSILLEFLEI